MNYAVILAEGEGKSFGAKIPKQFLKLNDKPILIHTIDLFRKNNDIDNILVVVLESWVSYTEELIKTYFPRIKNIKIVEGGINKIDSTLSGLNFIQENYELSNDDIVVIHDSVRPFCTKEVIKENIKIARLYGAVTTAKKSKEKMMICTTNNNVSEVLENEYIYQMQTPQTFRAKELYNLLEKTTNRNKIIDLLSIYKNNNKVVKIVEGNENNFIITKKEDLERANKYLAR